MPERHLPTSLRQVPHEADLRFVFMPERFWQLQSDLRSSSKHLEAADETGRIVRAFIKGEEGAYFPQEMAITADGPLKYVEWATKTSRKKDGFISAAREKFWQRLYDDFNESPFEQRHLKPAGAPYDFASERRHAVEYAVAWEGGVSVAEGWVEYGGGKLKGVLGKVAGEGKSAEADDDLLALVEREKKGGAVGLGLWDVKVGDDVSAGEK